MLGAEPHWLLHGAGATLREQLEALMAVDRPAGRSSTPSAGDLPVGDRQRLEILEGAVPRRAQS